MNIKDLKEIIKDLPEDMEVVAAEAGGAEDGTEFYVREKYSYTENKFAPYLWCGAK